MAGSALRVYVRRIVVYQLTAATTGAVMTWRLFRLSTAGTGGTVIGSAALDPADAAAGATGMALPTVAGTTSNVMWIASSYLLQTVGASMAPGELPKLLDIDFEQPHVKPLIIAAGTSNGISL